MIKGAAAEVNMDLGLLDRSIGAAIVAAARDVEKGVYPDQFPLDVFQTGSGTSTNMNVNEVIATLAQRAIGRDVHPNDHVNLCQSSNDVIPTAIHVTVAQALGEELMPAVTSLEQIIDVRRVELDDVVKTGRTHLMDAVPIRMGQELSAWKAQVVGARQRLDLAQREMLSLAIGGTAVGTGLNTTPDFGERVARRIADRSGLPFATAPNRFAAIAAQDPALNASAQLRGTAVVLLKIANDLRWMNSGPLAGLAEIALPALQPGSSIMPGKVNPVVPEACAMVAAQIIGNDTAITVAGQSGNFQLNVMLPVVAHNLLQSIEILAAASRALADSAIAGFTVNRERLTDALERNPILVTALNPVIGYEKGAAVAKKAYARGEPILRVAAEETDLSEAELKRLLDPASLTEGGIKG
jgi:fumarate hydratase class II